MIDKYFEFRKGRDKSIPINDFDQLVVDVIIMYHEYDYDIVRLESNYKNNSNLFSNVPLSEDLFKQITNLIKESSIQELKEFSIILTNTFHRRGSFIPKLFFKILIGLIDLKPNNSVLDTNCLHGEFLYELSKISEKKELKLKLLGVDSDKQSARHASFLVGNKLIKNEYFLKSNMKLKFDNILVYTDIEKTFGKYYKKTLDLSHGTNCTITFDNIFKSLSLLKNDGTLIALINLELLNSTKNKRAVKYLIKENLVDTVISLREKQPSSNSAQQAILILKKDRKRTDYIQFIYDVTPSFDFIRTDVSTIIDSYKNKTFKVTFSGLVYSDMIKRENYELSPKIYTNPFFTYLNEKLKEGAYARLDQFVSVVEGVSTSAGQAFIRRLPDSKKIFSVKVLNKIHILESISEVFLNEAKIEDQDLSKLSPFYLKVWLKKGDIIASASNNKLKIIVYNSDSPMAVFVDDGKVQVWRPKNPSEAEYIYFQLHDKTAEIQILFCVSVGGISDIKDGLKNKLMNVKIPKLNDIDKNDFLKGIKHKIILEQEEKLLNIKKSMDIKTEADDKVFRTISFLCHDLDPKFGIMRHNAEYLIKVLDDKNLLDQQFEEPLDDEDHPKTNRNLLNEIIDISKHSDSLLKVMRKFIEGKSSSVNKEPVNLTNLFQNTFTQYESSQISIDFISQESGKEIVMSVYKTLFTELFNNLFRNAKMHGLKSSGAKLNLCIRVIADESDFIIIEYFNDGNVFPENINEVDFLNFGYKDENSDGLGIGGAMVGKVLDYHDASFRIIRDTAYGLHFEFKFPIGE